MTETTFTRWAGCSNEKCQCHFWPVCREYMEDDEGDFCARCGWEAAAHGQEFDPNPKVRP